MIEISRTQGFRPSTLGIDLKTAWGDVKTIIDKGAALITPSTATPKPVLAPTPAPASSGISTTMIVVGLGLAAVAGVAIFMMSKD